MNEIAETHRGQRVVVVTHAGFLVGFFEFVLGMKYGNSWRFQRSNASYNAFRYEDQRWCLETWGDRSHLPSDR